MATSKTKSIPGFANPKCYARALKDCCRQMSGEHPMSRALLERVDQELGELSVHVEVRNLAFQMRGVAEPFGIGNLERKILCHHHNGGLSPLDAEAVKTFEALEKLHYAAAGREVAAQPTALATDRRMRARREIGGLHHTEADGAQQLVSRFDGSALASWHRARTSNRRIRHVSKPESSGEHGVSESLGCLKALGKPVWDAT